MKLTAILYYYNDNDTLRSVCFYEEPATLKCKIHEFARTHEIVAEKIRHASEAESNKPEPIVSNVDSDEMFIS